ncbi:hypothetical protein SCHPADRAFT_890762 [Schizopora paradoxa]|uniref:Uncharacterized protein n=1 Tax=Schizopora paradoxa TaxID=27342 RepID=A0A0H2S6K2_9AGAM|nr:hypothetical protein SCHPADRAFT_890762 [Schizopora paradoxa]
MTSKSIALFGSHTEEFVSELKNANYELVKYGSSTEIEFDSPQQAVVVVSGVEHGFDHRAHLSDVLKSGKVLVVFVPGEEFLAVLHDITKTPIDLSKIQTTTERPLMVYEAHGTIRVVLPAKDTTVTYAHPLVSEEGDVLRNTEGNENPAVEVSSTPSSRASDAVKLLNDAVNNIQSPPPAGAGASNNDSLDPGSDVAFYKSTIVTVPHSFAMTKLVWSPEGKYMATTSDPKLIQGYLLTWNIYVYVYATDKNPAGTTPEDYKGTIYTYMLHRYDDSSFVHDSKAAPRWLGPNSSVPGESDAALYFVDYLEYLIEDTSGKLRKYSSQPDSAKFERDTNGGTVHFNYNISQNQAMTLFRANKKQTFNFTAAFEKPCSWRSFQLHNGGIDTQSTHNITGFSLAYNDYYDYWADPDFKSHAWWDPGVYNSDIVKPLPEDNLRLDGLNVYSSSVGNFPLKFKVNFNAVAFKGRGWRTDTDDKYTHKQTDGVSSSFEMDFNLDLSKWD